MICEKCGKELTKVGTLTEEEIEQLILINKKFSNFQQALNSDTLVQMDFADGQVYEYFRAVYDIKAQAEFLHYIFFRNLRKRLNLMTYKGDVRIGDGPDNYDIFIHPFEEDKENTENKE